MTDVLMEISEKFILVNFKKSFTFPFSYLINTKKIKRIEKSNKNNNRKKIIELIKILLDLEGMEYRKKLINIDIEYKDYIENIHMNIEKVDLLNEEFTISTLIYIKPVFLDKITLKKFNELLNSVEQSIINLLKNRYSKIEHSIKIHSILKQNLIRLNLN